MIPERVFTPDQDLPEAGCRVVSVGPHRSYGNTKIWVNCRCGNVYVIDHHGLVKKIRNKVDRCLRCRKTAKSGRPPKNVETPKVPYVLWPAPSSSLGAWYPR